MKKSIIYFAILVLLFFTGFQVHCKKSPEIDERGTVYFLVSEITPFHGDSFILPLTRPEDITAAEAIVSGSSRPKIVSAQIYYGSGNGVYKNKDLLSPGKRVWSWHVVTFNQFADASAEIYDSWPTYVEENLDFWMQQNRGIIAFWNYTVTRKVNLSELK